MNPAEVKTESTINVYIGNFEVTPDTTHTTTDAESKRTNLRSHRHGNFIRLDGPDINFSLAVKNAATGEGGKAPIRIKLHARVSRKGGNREQQTHQQRNGKTSLFFLLAQGALGVTHVRHRHRPENSGNYIFKELSYFDI